MERDRFTDMVYIQIYIIRHVLPVNAYLDLHRYIAMIFVNAVTVVSLHA